MSFKVYYYLTEPDRKEIDIILGKHDKVLGILVLSNWYSIKDSFFSELISDGVDIDYVYRQDIDMYIHNVRLGRYKNG